MAIALKDKENVDAPSALYPNGNIRDNPGNGTGTPVNKQVYADLHQFFARLLVEGGITPNGQPENAYDGFQYIQALFRLTGGLKWTDPINIGPWNMNAGSGALKAVPHGVADFTKIRAITVMVRDDTNTSIRELISPNYNAISGNLLGGTINGIGVTNVNLAVLIGSIFDVDTSFSSVAGSYNRGWVRVGCIS